jgi:hypothetical protein
LLSSSIDFMRAEAALFGGTGTAKIHMIAASTKVRHSPQEISANLAFVPAASQDTQYLLKQVNLDAAVTPIGRLNVIVSEFMVSLYGNGIDAYNAIEEQAHPTTAKP